MVPLRKKHSGSSIFREGNFLQKQKQTDFEARSSWSLLWNLGSINSLGSKYPVWGWESDVMGWSGGKETKLPLGGGVKCFLFSHLPGGNDPIWSNLTNIFQMGWNHQLDPCFGELVWSWYFRNSGGWTPVDMEMFLIFLAIQFRVLELVWDFFHHTVADDSSYSLYYIYCL